jgi:hypothetical protein
LEGEVHCATGSGFNGPSIGERRYLLLIKESMENHIPVTIDGSTAAYSGVLVLLLYTAEYMALNGED